MTRDEAIAMIKLQLGFRQTLDTEIIACLKLAQTSLESSPTKPWFLVSERATVLTTANDERVPVPDDFLAEIDEEGLKYVPPVGKSIPLIKGEYDQLMAWYNDGVEEEEDITGLPVAYALVGDYFRLIPKPDQAYPISMIYYKRDIVLDTNVENGWLKHVPLLLIGTGLDMITTPARDADAKKQAGQWIAAGMKMLHNMNETRQHMNQVYQMGGAHN